MQELTMSTKKDFPVMLHNTLTDGETEIDSSKNKRGKAKFIITQLDCNSNTEFMKKPSTDCHYLPISPSTDQCFLYYYITHEYESWYRRTNAILPSHLDDDYVLKMSGYANLTRASSWRLRDGEWFDDDVVNSYLMFLQLNDKNRSYEGKKRIWYLSTFYGATNDLRDLTLHEQFCGDWEEMGYIAVPLNVHNCHWFMMAISFIHKEIFILDSCSGCGYTDRNIKAKVTQIHNMLNKESEYRYDITRWNVWYMNDDVPQQQNGNDCGPFMCFFMTHLRDLIPIPKKQFIINVEYLRIWIANEMARSVYNLHKKDLLEGLESFKDADGNQQEFPRNIDSSSEGSEEPTNQSIITEQIMLRRFRQRNYYARLAPEEKQNQIKKVVENKKRKNMTDPVASVFKQKSKEIQIIERRDRQRNRYINLSPEEKHNYVKNVIDNRKRKLEARDALSMSDKNIIARQGSLKNRYSEEKETQMKKVVENKGSEIAERRDRQRKRYKNLTPEEKNNYVQNVLDNRKRKREARNTSAMSDSSVIARHASPKNRYAGLTPEQRQMYINKVIRNKEKRKNKHSTGSLQVQLSEPHRVRQDAPCTFCFAKRLESEPPSFCCQKGKVHLPVTAVPHALYELFHEQTDEGLEFRRHIRAYNSIFSFTSMGVKLDKNLASSRKGVYTFRVQGQIYHDLPALIPSDDCPCYFQLYFYDTDHEMENRLKIMKDAPLSKTIVEKLKTILSENPYSQVFRRLADTDLDTYEIHISSHVKLDQRVYNRPTAEQVAAIWIEGNNPHVRHNRDIIVHSTSGHRHRVQHYFGCYDPLQYPLLFPGGDIGWHQNILKRKPGEVFNKDTSNGVQKDSLCGNLVPSSAEAILGKEKQGTDGGSPTKVSCREYYCYKFQIRDMKQSILLHSGRLLQQYIVDMYIKLENTRLDYFRNNQSDLRAELYQGIVDSVLFGESRGSMVGTFFMLPPSFVGGPRDMRRRYLDAMALVHRFGKPDLFITMTCNPEWEEIRDLLEEGEEPQDRPDVVVRVFRAKIYDLKTQLFKKNIFGTVAAHVHVIEFQKRGLPHVHMLVIFKSQFKITSADQYDKYVCAEIPDPDVYPDLYGKVVKHMMHGPCGKLNEKNPCMVEGKCKSKYPRSFCEVTKQGDDSYAIYRRRNNSRKVQVRSKTLDNRWVVPYNPYLLSRYNCHINVEICSCVKAVKYMYKYIYKGHDKVEICVDQSEARSRDEIREYQNGRWVSPQEAIWRIFEFNLHDMLPAVINLQLHLPNKHYVPYWKHQDLKKLLMSDTPSKTMLTEFFTFCLNDKGKRQLLYREFPEYFVWDSKSKCWNERKTRNVIGRINGANPQEGERYYLRLLLNHVRSPTSYLYLLTYDGIQYTSFKAAAEKRGLLQSEHWISECLLEATSFQMPLALRRLFATILVYCAPTNVRDLWNSHYEAISEDFAHQSDITAAQRLRETLKSVNYFLQSMGKKIEEFDLPALTVCIGEKIVEKREILDELSIETPTADYAAVINLNDEQRIAYDEIMDHVENNKNKVFFIDGPGGTGKTFLYRALLSTIRSRGFIGIATATSGVAASIMPGGRTAHSRFKIPIDVNESSTCNIPKQSGTAELLRRAKLLIWDEAPMAKCWAIETLDRSLKDLLGNDMPFGGKIVVFGGDFRQVLPVVTRGTRAETVNACLVKSYVWPDMKKLKLSKNMRAQNDSTFSDFLLNVGNGDEPTFGDDLIKIPSEMVVKEEDGDSEASLINSIFPSLNDHAHESEFVTERAILATRNEYVDMLNDKLIKSFPGLEQRYTSYDKAIDDSHNYYPEEFLNTLLPNGLPPHELVLKVNSPIMLLRNLNPSDGLCNGTRMVCKAFDRNVIHAEITLGQHAGKQVLIPRIPLQPAENENYPFKFQRNQFPVRLCFAMTINKSQGQTIPHVGIYLPEHVFSHGQLYVALSRGISMSTTRILIKTAKAKGHRQKCTKNIVYKEILRT